MPDKDGLPTKGEERVRLTFNPIEDEVVSEIKKMAADLIDYIEALEPIGGIDATNQGEFFRLKAMAQTDIESASMWAVKARTI